MDLLYGMYALDVKHLVARLRQNCNWQERQGLFSLPLDIDKEYILELLKNRIKDLDINAAKRDVEVFISDHRVLDIWSKEFFMDTAGQIRFQG